MALLQIAQTGHFFQQLYKILLTALAYYIAGALGLTLALPPGYATIFWPASGLAVAAVYVYGPVVSIGVFLGSASLNFISYFPHTPIENLHILYMNACLIGFASSLQALLSSYLLRRFIPQDTRLQKTKTNIMFLLLAGPVACLTASSIAISALIGTKTIHIEQAPFMWWTWYIGDTLGVIVFAPLLAIILKRRDISVRRKLSVTPPMLAIFAIVILLFFPGYSLGKNAQGRNI